MRRAIRVLSLSLLIGAMVAPLSVAPPVYAAGLTVEILASPYAVVDSNKPTEEGPEVLVVAAKITNTSGSTCENIDVYIGDGSSPGAFDLGTQGATTLATSLSMPGCISDAHRFIPSLSNNEYAMVIWPIAYPREYAPGPSPTPYTYNLTVWAESQDESCDGSDSHSISTRSTIEASANKVLGTVTKSPSDGVVSAGNIVEVTLTGFNFGTVGAGESASLEPIGNIDFDPCCFRLVSTKAVISSIDGTGTGRYPMPSDRLYFENIGGVYDQDPTDYVTYRFIALGDDCSTNVKPYQEVASGTQHKYSADYNSSGTTLGIGSDGGAIELEKSVSPSSAAVDETLTWTITYTNTSDLPVGDPDNGAALVVIDQGIPDGTEYLTGTASSSRVATIFYSEDDGATWSTTEPDPANVTMIKWRISEIIPAGEAGTVSFDTNITNADEPICNSAVAQIEGGQPIASTSVCANQLPDVDAIKVDALLTDNGTVGYVDPGDVLEYTVTITADGAALNVTYNDVLDPNVTLVDDSITTDQGSVTSPNNEGDPSVSVNIGTIAAGDSVTITYEATVNDPLPEGVTHIENQGIVTGSNFPSEPTNDPDTAPDDDPTVVPVTAAPDIEVLKTDSLVDDADSNGVPSPGDTLEYEIVVTNIGNEDGTAAVLIDSMPDYTSLVVGSVTAVPGTVVEGNTAGDTMVEVDIGTLAGGGGSATVTFQVLIDDIIPAGVETISNQAIVTGTNFPTKPSDDPDTGTVDDPTDTEITASPLLEVDKRATPGADTNGDGYLNPGEQIIYTITIGNSGNQEATSVVFSDTPDSNTSLVVGSVSSSQGTVVTGNTAGDSTVVVNVGTVQPEQEVEISFTVEIDPGAPTHVENQGIASGGNFEDEPSDDPATPADDDPTVSPIVVGQTGEPLIESYKTDLLVVDADSSGSLSGGDTVEYVVSITNSGTAPADGATFTDTPDTNTALAVGSVTTSLGSVVQGNTSGDTGVEVNIGTINVGVTATITFRVVLHDGIYSSIANQGSVDWDDGSEPTDDPDTDTEDDPTESPVPTLDVEADKADTWQDTNFDGVVNPGETITYTVTITRHGCDASTPDAQNVVYSDTLDPNVTLAATSVTTSAGSVSTGNSAGDTSVVVDVGNITNCDDIVITYEATVNDPLPEGVTHVTNQGIVTGDNFPSEPTNDPDTAPDDDPTVVPVTAAPDIEVLKTDSLYDDADSNGVPGPGDTLEYEIVVTNTGNEDGTAAILIDAMPDYTSLVVGTVTTSAGSIVEGNTAGDTIVQVDIGTLAGMVGSATVTFRIVIDDIIPAGVDTISNQAIVTGTNFPTEPSDDPDTGTVDDPTDTGITASPLLEVDKRATPVADDVIADGQLNPGEQIIYTITIGNSGNQEATSVVFSDTPDSNTSLVVGSVSSSQGNVVTGNTGGDSTVVVNVGTVQVGQEVEISFTAIVHDPDAFPLTRVENQGIASGSNFDDEPSDDPETPADDDPTVSPIVDEETSEPLIESYKTDFLVVDADGSGNLSHGDTVEYVVEIHNHGTAAAGNVVYTDSPDANTDLVVGSVVPSQGDVSSGNGMGDTTVQVDIGSIPVGGTVTIAYRVRLQPGTYDSIGNQGVVAANEVEDEPTDDPATGDDDDPTDAEVNSFRVLPPNVNPVGGEALRPNKTSLISGLLLLFGAFIAVPFVLRRALNTR